MGGWDPPYAFYAFHTLHGGGWDPPYAFRTHFVGGWDPPYAFRTHFVGGWDPPYAFRTHFVGGWDPPHALHTRSLHRRTTYVERDALRRGSLPDLGGEVGSL